MRLFISYSYNDYYKLPEVLKKIQDKLPELKEAEVWDPTENLSAGDNFREEIKKQIKSADLYILFWSEGAADSPWVLYEAGMADASGKPIVVAVEPGSPELFDTFKKYQVIELEKES